MKFTKKEIVWILITIILFWLIIGFRYDFEKRTLQFDINPFLFLTAITIIIVNIIAKKIAAPRYSSKIEITIWQWERWGWYKRSHLKKPVPMGIFFTLLVSFFSLGLIKPLTFLQYETKNDYPKRLLKKQGTRRAERKIELNEVDIAFISVYGFYSLLFLALIGALIKGYFNFELGYYLAKYSIFYGAWNLIPFGNLDGSKTFFGSPVSYSLLLILYSISIILVFMF